MSVRLCCLSAVMAASMAALPASAASVKLIHAFGKTSQGDFPTGGLLAIGNLFYGVTASGGKASGACGQFSCGVVFSLTREGHETVLHQFNGKDGYLPAGGLVALNGVLYGTTMSGGSSKHGTIFSITPQGNFSTIYSFSGAGDGSAPVNSMVAVGNVLYGATASGGLNNNGTAFSITPWVRLQICTSSVRPAMLALREHLSSNTRACSTERAVPVAPRTTGQFSS